MEPLQTTAAEDALVAVFIVLIIFYYYQVIRGAIWLYAFLLNLVGIV